ncbi:adenylate/guanylate cyclase domain-containing protein [Rhodoferax sp. AJA081-3]|nr:adenylate/guanylate cyclase domain-containing protein [Rhodoferax sp. AJA081-3]
MSHLWALCGVVVLVLAALALYLADPIAVQNLRLAQFDQLQRWHPRPYTPVPVRVVDIDEAALQAYGQWPWPRTRVAELVERLHGAGASAIALDVLLSEPDRNAPSAMAQLWQDPQANAALAHLPDPDLTLAKSLLISPVVLGSSLARQAVGSTAALPATTPLLPYRLVSSGDPTASAWLQRYDTVLWPLPALTANAKGVGALNAAPDADGVVRRVPLLLRVDATPVPSLSAEALRVAQGASNYLLRSQAAGVQDLRIGAVTVPTNAQGEIWLHYTQPHTARVVSAAQVLNGTVAADQLQGHVVLVGSSAAGLMDVRSNPLGQQMPGVLAHALAVEQMLLGHHLQRPSWATGLEAVVLLGSTLLLGLLGLALSARRAALALLAALAATWGGAWYAFVHAQLLLDAVNPTWAMLLVFGLASGMHHWVGERQQRWLRSAFARYVSPNRVDHLVAHPEQLHLGGQRQVCSFVFTDLAGFTPLLEASDPAQMVGLLNDYLDGMLQIAFRHEGTLDRFVGDAMAVLFSAPVVQADHQQRALDCALEMDTFATAYVQRLQARGVAWGLTRIGVHSGEVMVGNFGGKTLFDYRALGDPINTAARLEGVNKHLGTRVCVSATLLEGCQGVAVRAVGRVLLKGKSQPLAVFAPEATLDLAQCAAADDYAAAMACLVDGAAQDPALALQRLEALAVAHPHDPLVALHVQRLRQGAVDDLVVMVDK